METVKVVFCHECKHYCSLENSGVPLLGGGMCFVDAPSHITMVPPKHFCSYGIEKSPAPKAEDST